MKNTKYKAVWIEFPVGNRAHGAGGWSRRAKCRPAPVRREIITSDVVITTGKSVIVDGLRKIKLNLFLAATGEIIRADYPTDSELTGFGLTSRQIAAKNRKAEKLDAKIEAARRADALAEAERRAQITANLPKDVAGWIAAGCVHPAPAEIVALKQASGLTWNQFEGKAARE